MNSLRLRLHALLLIGLALLLVVQLFGLRVIPQSLVENYRHPLAARCRHTLCTPVATTRIARRNCANTG